MGSALAGRSTPNQMSRVNNFGKNKITLELGVLGPYYVVGPALGLERSASTGDDRANQGNYMKSKTRVARVRRYGAIL